MWLRERITVYSENHIKHKNKLPGQNENNIKLKEVV
jgi:hypothetical protein